MELSTEQTGIKVKNIKDLEEIMPWEPIIIWGARGVYRGIEKIDENTKIILVEVQVRGSRELRGYYLHKENEWAVNGNYAIQIEDIV